MFFIVYLYQHHLKDGVSLLKNMAMNMSVNSYQLQQLYFLFGYVPLSLAIGMILTFVSLKGCSSIPAAFGHACYNRCMVGFIVLLDPERSEALLSPYSFDQPLYYCIVLMFAVGIPMMVHLRKLEKQGKLTFQNDRC